MPDGGKRDWREIARQLAGETNREKIHQLLEELNEAWMHAHPDSAREVVPSQPPKKANG